MKIEFVTSGGKRNMIKILHLIGSVDPEIGGPVETIKQQASIFPAFNIVQEVASLDQPEAPFLSNFPIRVHPLGMPGKLYRRFRTTFPLFRYRFSFRYRHWLRDNLWKYDIIFVHGLWTFTTLGAADILVRQQKKYFVYFHGALDPWFKHNYPIKHMIKQLFWLFGDGPLVRSAHCVLFTSEQEKVLARGQFWGYRYREHVISYGITGAPENSPKHNDAFWQAVPSLAPGSRYILFLGRVTPKKGCDLLIRAFATISKRFRDIDLVIAGPSDGKLASRLLALCSRLGISERVHFPGMIAGDAKWGAFRTCYAFVPPSHTENFGIAVVEALSCGKPVVITDKVNISGEISAMGAGIVGPNTYNGVHQALEHLLSLSPEAYHSIEEAARHCFMEHFFQEKTILALCALISAEQC